MEDLLIAITYLALGILVGSLGQDTIKNIIDSRKALKEKKSKKHKTDYEVSWHSATSMTKSSIAESYAYGTYEDFLKFMLTVTWKRNNKYPTSYFSEDHDKFQVHASQFIFDGVGMLFDYDSYCKVADWLEDNKLPYVEKLIEKEW